MTSLVFSTSVFEQIKNNQGASLLIGQIYDEINVFSYLPLSDDFDNWSKALDTKDLFANFLNGVQDVTLFVSNGMKSLGFVFSEQKEFFSNLSILKKITKAINNPFLIFAFQSDLSKFYKFDLQSSKVETIQNKKFEEFQLVEYNMKFFVDINITQNGQININNLKKQIESSQLMINGTILFSDKDTLEKTNNGERVQEVFLIQAQSESEENILNSEDVNTVKGFIYPTVLIKQDMKVQQLKKLLMDDVEDIISIKYHSVENVKYEKEYLQTRIKFYLQKNLIPFQDYYPPTLDKKTIETDLQKKLIKLTKMQMESIIIQENFQQLNLTEIKKPIQQLEQLQEQNIDEVKHRNTNEQNKQESKILEEAKESAPQTMNAKESSLYLLLIIVLVILIGIVLKNMK